MQDFEWLSEAQSLPVGRSKRIYHGAEHRPNLVVSNKTDKWTAYCFKCKQYSEKRKDFVRILDEQSAINETVNNRTEENLFIDLLCESAKTLTPLSDIVYFLHSKHMALTWLKDYNPRWDPKRRRLVIDFQGKTIGRDIYGISNCKWYRYNGTYRSATIDQQNIEERWFNHRFEDVSRRAETTVLT